MDAFEAPNVRGANPIVMATATEAEAWCGARGKRLCTEYEWESACEGDDLLPYSYGVAQDDAACNTAKPWRPFNAWLLVSGGEAARKETERLWQGEPSGSRSSCATRDGVYDLIGNAEEWIRSSRKRKWNVALIGGHWAKPWSRCRDTNDAHEPFFRFYEVGFRCCQDPSR
jgi:formylglycine-generating enzyme required for sulfatase activity